MNRKNKYQEDQPQVSDRPPRVLDVLAPIFKGHSSKHIPISHYDAAEFWIRHQEKSTGWQEKIEKINDMNGNLAGWKTPYHDRVCSTARKFLLLNEIERAFVIDRIEYGVPWRGDEMDFYKMVCKQSVVMLKDPDAYVNNAHDILRYFKRAHK